MLLRKFIIAFLSFILLSQTLVFTQEKSPADKPEQTEVSAAVKEKAYKLLSRVAGESSQLIIPQNRVYFQLIAADLMWEHNEKEARGLFLNAQTELRSMMDQAEAKLNQAALEEEVPAPSDEEELVSEYDVRNLREKLVLTLAAHDPKAALDALQALKPSPNFKPRDENYNPLSGEDSLELKISAAIVQKDPTRAFEVAKANLAKGFSDNMLEVMNDIYKKDAQLGAKFAKEIFSKIKVSKIQTSSEAANMARPEEGQPVKITPEISIWIATQFLKNTSQSLKTAEKANKANPEKKTVPLLSEAEVREMANLIAQKLISQPQIYPYEVGSVLPELMKYAPAQAQSIKRKLGAEGAKQAEEIGNGTAEYEENAEKNAAELADFADKAAPDKRDYLYAEAVRKAIEADDIENARKYFAKIKEQVNFGWLKTQIEDASLLDKARKGNVEEVRKLIVKSKTGNEKIVALCELARTLAEKGEIKVAGQLIDEARNYLPARFKTADNLASYIEIVRGSAFVNEEQSFAFLENSLSTVNELIAAAVLVDDFNQYGATRRDELNYDSIERQALRNFPNSVEVIQKLAAADFDRTANLADKFTRNDVRIFARLRIISALLDEKAAEKEEQAAQMSQGEGDH